MTLINQAYEEPRSSLFDTKRKSNISEEFQKEITDEEIDKLGYFQQGTPTSTQTKIQYPESEELLDKVRQKFSNTETPQSKIITQQSKGNNTDNSNQIQKKNSTGNKQIEIKQVQKRDEYEMVVKCFKINSSILTTTQNVTITISAPEKHSGGFFQSDYITYSVYTDPLNYKVRRRYSDFEWLRGILLDFFPGSMIPPIPGKNFGDRLQEGFIEKRMRYLQVIYSI